MGNIAQRRQMGLALSAGSTDHDAEATDMATAKRFLTTHLLPQTPVAHPSVSVEEQQ
jgi:hypothetical protein